MGYCSVHRSRANAPVYIDCQMDFDSLIKNAFSREFIRMGFPVAETRNAADVVCRITVDEGMQQRELGIFYHPSLQAVVSDNGGTIAAFNAEGERSSAVTPGMAKRRACQSLADKVNESFTLVNR